MRGKGIGREKKDTHSTATLVMKLPPCRLGDLGLELGSLGMLTGANNSVYHHLALKNGKLKGKAIIINQKQDTS